MRRNETSTQAVDPFALKLPAAFDVKPQYTVPLPGKCQALVYAVTRNVNEYTSSGKQKTVTRKGWRVVTVNRNGRPPRSIYSNHYTRGCAHDCVLTDPLDVQLHIKSLVFSLSKKRTSNQVEEDFDD